MFTRVIIAIGLSVAASSPCFAQESCRTPRPLRVELVYSQDEAPLTEIGSMSVDGAGNLSVADDRTRSVLVFGRNGHLSSRLGRSGEGPGEFRKVSNVLSLGDTIWAADTELRRGHFFRSDGTLIRTVTFRSDLGGYGFGRTYPLGGGFVVMPRVGVVGSDDELGIPQPILRVGPNGQYQGALAEPIRLRGVVSTIELPGGGQAFVILPLQKSDYISVAPGGTHAVIARGTVGEGGTRVLTVTSVSTAGDTLSIKRLVLPAAKAPSSYIDREFEKLLDTYRARFPNPMAARQAVERAWNVKPELWSVHGLLVGARGQIWVRTNPIAEEWLILSAEGDVLGCVDAPDGTRIYATSGDEAWGTQFDDLGVPSIVRLRISK